MPRKPNIYDFLKSYILQICLLLFSAGIAWAGLARQDDVDKLKEKYDPLIPGLARVESKVDYLREDTRDIKKALGIKGE